MKKQQSNRRLQWLIAILIGLGALTAILVVAINGQMAAEQKAEAEQQAASEAATKTEQEAAEMEQYTKCIDNANEVANKYAKDAPEGLSPDQYLAYTQTIAQARDSAKADCDRMYGN